MIEIKDLSIGYSRRTILSGLNAVIPSGTFVVMAGCNGSGKSTLLRTLAGLLPPVSGKIIYDGKDLSSLSIPERSRLLSFVNTEKVRIPGLSCHDLVALGRSPYTGWSGSLSSADESAIEKALSLAGMSSFSSRMLDTMSDGECQMASIARAIAQDTPLILLDEPTAFLDWPNRRKTAILLKRLSSDAHKTVICSTHDLEVALQFSDLLLLLTTQGLYLAPPSSPALRSRLKAAFGVERVFFSADGDEKGEAD